MASNSATGIASQQSIKAYVDAQITAEDLDITTDSGTIAIDLDSETLTVSGGTGLDSSATGNAVTLAIDSTVATLTGSQTLTNKSLTTPTLTGTAVVASLDISGDIDVDGTTNLDVVDIDGAVDMASTLTVTGVAILNGGIDVAGDITLDADGGDIFIKDDGTQIGSISNAGSNNFQIASTISDGDFLLKGNDGGSAITALTLDMSDAGTAVFNHDIKLADNGKAIFGAGSDLQIYHDGSNSYIDESGTGNLRIRGSQIILEKYTGETILQGVADGSVYIFHDNSQKLATNATGIDVTGLVEFDSLSGTGSVAITDIADEDDMSSNSATQLSTQQSIKAYADTKASPGFAVAMAIAL